MIAPDPCVRVHLDGGAMLESPPGWPQLPAPEPGELMTAYIARAIFGDAFFHNVEQLCRESGSTFRLLRGLRPAHRTAAAWQAKYPRRVFTITSASASSELFELRELVYWRLVAALFDQLRSGELHAKGRRLDVVGGDANVPVELWGNPDMVWLHAGEFLPRQRQGRALPGSALWSFVELTLWPAAPSAKAGLQRRVTPKQRLTDALLARHRDGVDVTPGALLVKELKELAERTAGLNRPVSDATFRRALRAARQHPVNG
jgi:hypothetical protein